ncbi:putative Cellulose-binding Sde182 nucleoside hydrolase-like domain-containing protein [Seiridium unicorne]|uniref:Cellulose-binding Sde182 nucleoside hydrolase-like domain-containing protein n=1 Tax=Seiridium unicorne TaxID=138068 RepID=A0ABR2UM98_9PEZI
MTSQTATTLQTYTNKPRVFILSDISNEPDDAESFVRYLTYANQFVTEGLVPVTSVWLRDRTCPDDMHTILDVYAGSLNNLNAHTHPNFPYPRVEELRGLIRPGASVYGMEAVGDDVPLSEGGELLKARIEASESLTEPLWVLCWGGTNVLAQVLYKIQNEYSSSKAASLRSKIRVYAISDQDDTSAWIRAEFPDIFYISSIHAWNQYGLATWVGISGETHYSFDKGGPDSSKVSKQWVKDNIQIGPLGSVYPNPEFVFEGDTPSFLYLIQNGLGSREHPNFGSWGGRYSKTDPSDRVRHYGDTADRVQGLDGRMYKSNQATIWRWRDAYQSDFAARIQWSMTDNFDKANHHPMASINGHDGLVPLTIDAEAGSTLRLDASASFDPDGDNLSFRWLQYEEPSIEVWSAHKFTAKLSIELLDREGKVVEVQIPPAEKCCVEFKTWKPLARGQILHLFLEVKDDGSPQLTTYKRVLIQTTNADVKL